MPASPAPSTPQPRRWWLVPGFVMVLTMVLGAPSLGRWFDNPDDWEHLDTAHRALSGAPGGWSAALFGDVGIASVRPVGALLWTWDQTVWGWSAGGYFFSNLLLMGILGALVSMLVARATKSAGLAAAGGVMVGLSVVANQPMYYLAGRDDVLANVFIVGAVLSWIRGRDTSKGRGLSAALTLLAALSKPTAVLTPLALVAADWFPFDGRAVREPRKLAQRQRPVLVALGAYALVLGWSLGFSFENLAPPAEAGGLALGVKNAVLPHVMPLFARHGEVPLLVGDALRLALLALGFWGARRGGAHRGLLVTGVALAAAGTLPVFPFLARAEFNVQDAGRYLQLPVVGVAVMICALVAGWSRRRDRWGWAMVVASVAAFVVGASPMLSGAFSPSRALFEAMEAEPGAAVLGVSRLDAGVSSMLLSDAVRGHRGAPPPELFLQGGETLFRGARGGERFRYGAFEVAGPLTTAALRGRTVLWDGEDASGVPVFLRAEPRVSRSGESRNWQLDASIATDRRLAPQALWRTLHHAREPGRFVVVPGPMDITASGQCGVEIELTAAATGPVGHRGPMHALLPSGHFALLLFSAEAEPVHPFEHWLVVPLRADSGRQSVRLDLRSAPSWDAVGTVRWMGVLPSNHPTQATVHRVSLQGCP